MNQRLYKATAQLPDDKIRQDKGAFFKSLFGTLNHILVGDYIWLKRFSSHPASQSSLIYFSGIETPKSFSKPLFAEFQDLQNERENIDQLIINWIDCLSEQDLNTTIRYKNMAGIHFEKDYSSLINHLFLHQVHHRGQASTLLSQFDIDFGDTDLVEII